MAHREFKRKIYAEFARIGNALGSARRLELLDLLAQGPRHVEALAIETDMSVANVSQHLQVLRQARLVDAEREGAKALYRLADKHVLDLWLTLRSVAEERFADLGQFRREVDVYDEDSLVPRDELESLIRDRTAVLIDTRPTREYEHGHLPEAISMPMDELPKRLHELPQDRPIIAYCRGDYCLFADEAVALLREKGFEAHRLEGGWPEWWAEDRAVAGGG
ncbi:MAG: metalloregulator ArsR/SmtB family transcription factor [Chloroflexi bacterium]|nr:metalloregulator ArsR/SmtB family transcription factor [Chloroflexota bacterium]MCH8065288.1 metalloregulator ArsR/SmtB family transcription factor [Chloroflexota bacterium]